jgi:hypothetical protein
MPTFIAVKAGKVVETVHLLSIESIRERFPDSGRAQLKGADPNGLARLVQQHAGPNPPIAPLAPIAEAAKVAGNVRRPRPRSSFRWQLEPFCAPVPRTYAFYAGCIRCEPV